VGKKRKEKAKRNPCPEVAERRRRGGGEKGGGKDRLVLFPGAVALLRSAQTRLVAAAVFAQCSLPSALKEPRLKLGARGHLLPASLFLLCRLRGIWSWVILFCAFQCCLLAVMPLPWRFPWLLPWPPSMATSSSNHQGSSELPVLLLSYLLILGPSQCVDEPQQASYKASPRNQCPRIWPQTLPAIVAHNHLKWGLG
jgi:hypothetical protein